MSAAWARRLLVAALGVWLAVLVADVVLSVLTWGADIPGTTTEKTGELAPLLGFAVAYLAYPLVGAAIVYRYPRNLIGWLFVCAGLVLITAAAGPLYFYEGRYVSPGSVPATDWAAWASGLADPLFFVFIALLLLLFPDGRPPSPRWRPVLWLLIGAVVASEVNQAVKPGLIRDDLPVRNPLGFDTASGVFGAFGFVENLMLLVAVLGSVVSIVWRFRHSRGELREQIKWIAFAGLGFVLAILIGIAATAAGRPGGGDAAVGLAFAGIPILAGFAILRYRLYEIDRLISRALGYAALSVVLGAAYVGLVLAGQAVFSSFVGGSNLAIAVSTLVVAALFLPVRARVQRFVDRRFYRRRYDAQRTLEAFGSRMREQVELDALRADLAGVVEETMQPGHVSTWVRTEST